MTGHFLKFKIRGEEFTTSEITSETEMLQKKEMLLSAKEVDFIGVDSRDS